jgi:hypothetical protein
MQEGVQVHKGKGIAILASPVSASQELMAQRSKSQVLTIDMRARRHGCIPFPFCHDGGSKFQQLALVISTHSCVPR